MPETTSKTKSRSTTKASGETAGKATPVGDKDHVCPVAFCPIGMALSAVQGAAPDALEHLLAAARELLLATRAVVDARAADFDDRGSRKTTLERIDIA